MERWDRVKWSAAGQVVTMLGEPFEGFDAQLDLPPAEYYHALREADRLDDAVRFLAQALLRYESVAWAARVVRDNPPAAGHSPEEAAVIRAALLWVQDPSDLRRRAAFDAAEAARGDAGAGIILGYAAFLSGGSLAPENLEPVLPPPESAGRLAGAAIMLATTYAADRPAALRSALELGEQIAREGIVFE